MENRRKFNIRFHSKFRRDISRMINKGKSLEKISNIIEQLSKGIRLEDKYNEHFLKWHNKYPDGTRECHIEPDWLLIYKFNKPNFTLHLLRTGSHDDLL